MIKSFRVPAEIFKVLAHPARLGILALLRDDEQCVCHMEAFLGLRQAAISQHLMILREAGLVADRRDGWNSYYRVVKPEIYPVLESVNALTGRTVLAIPERPASSCPCPKCNPSGTNNE